MNCQVSWSQIYYTLYKIMCAEVLTCFFHTTAPPVICLGHLTHMKCLTILSAVICVLKVIYDFFLQDFSKIWPNLLLTASAVALFFSLQTISSATLSGSCQRHPNQSLPHHSPQSAVRLHHSYPWRWRWGWGGIKGIKYLSYRILLSYIDICAKRSLCEIRKWIQEYFNSCLKSEDVKEKLCKSVNSF